ncbi:larval cuticle protein 2-like [Daphnia pulicaria]|uniref:larval cuticle protein 2-like n=1 Tax=Daphnia pulicaria TaxID=35523 RepID=UPI001EE9E645|nr:larval cuticle protein 2-like [Daphnia pulicaria]
MEDEKYQLFHKSTEFNMKLFVIAAVLAVAAAAPSSYKPEYKAPAYAAPSYSAPSYSAPAYAAPAYAAPAYKDNKYADITITSQSDERNLDGSSQWSYAQSDYTTREESQVQKKMQGVKYDSYGKATYEDVMGNTNKGSSYWISPEGEKFTLTWAADEEGFKPQGAHLPVAPVHVYELPVAPVHEYELPVAPVHEYELPVAPALPYKRTGAGYSSSSY